MVEQPMAAPSAGDGASETITVLLCWSPEARHVHELPLQVPAESTVRAVLSGVAARAACAALVDDPASLEIGIWGRRAQMDDVLREGDRLELYRALTVDPKYARRERFRRQGARSAGLFAARRPGGKQGY
jgi:uncharacterized protein